MGAGRGRTPLDGARHRRPPDGPQPTAQEQATGERHRRPERSDGGPERRRAASNRFKQLGAAFQQLW
eukprot:14029529-Alexandrium_andersonii.AAC.1